MAVFFTDYKTGNSWGFENTEQWQQFSKQYYELNGSGIEVDWSAVARSIRNMTNNDARKAVKRIIRQSANKIKKPVQAEIKSRYPGGKKYPKNPGRKSGYLRGKHYGPLYKDVKVSVYKNAQGASVSLFSPKNPAKNRWCVLIWQNDGTEERTAKRSIYQKATTYGHKSWWWNGQMRHSYQRKNGKMSFLANREAPSRGRLSPSHFFETTAQASLNQSADFAAAEFQRVFVTQFNKQ